MVLYVMMGNINLVKVYYIVSAAETMKYNVVFHFYDNKMRAYKFKYYYCRIYKPKASF